MAYQMVHSIDPSGTTSIRSLAQNASHSRPAVPIGDPEPLPTIELSVTELKAALRCRGVSIVGCTEKHELAGLLHEATRNRSAQGCSCVHLLLAAVTPLPV